MDSVQVRIRLPAELREPLAAVLSACSAQGFQQDEDDFVAYWLVADFSDDVRATLAGFMRRHGLDPRWAEETIPDRNWNEIWERSFRPIIAGSFFIRPSWYRPDEVDTGRLELVVDPKMSFGTGHHETTRLMLYHLERQTDRLRRVLDAGSGTGILAIAAYRLGAAFVLAYDLDPRCMVNARENLDENGIRDGVEIRTGTLDAVHEGEFTLIMANINKNVLLADLEGFRNRLAGSGVMVLSGLLISDREEMLAAIERLHLRPVEERTEGEWWSVSLTHVSD
jgi:ribosomal protein L11 methyltransferase